MFFYYRNEVFEKNVRSIIQSLKLQNYNIMALKGLSTAFTRTFMSNPSVNGSLSTVQEISSGIVKQGFVDILLEQSGKQESIFTVRICCYYYLLYLCLFGNLIFLFSKFY